MRTGLIGGGFMGEALVSALLKEGVVQASDVTVSDVAEARREHLSSRYGVGVTDQNTEAAQGAEVVVLAVKPQEFSAVAAGLRGRVERKQTLLSIMAGVPIERIGRELEHEAVVRAMPNTAAFVGQAMSVWTASEAVSPEGREAAEFGMTRATASCPSSSTTRPMGTPAMIVTTVWLPSIRPRRSEATAANS